jgi:hypothetical protein
LRTFQWLLRALLAIGLTHSAPLPGLAASTTPDIRGIYVNGQKFYLSNGQLAQAIAMPGVDGILVNLDWTDVASPTTARTYSWTLLDSMVQLAVAQGKKFEIDIITGGSTPSWVFAPAPQGLGAASGNFVYVQSNKPGAACLNEKLALPWDPNYIAALTDLLQQLSAHLNAQGTYASMTMLRLTGINTLTDELRLPGQTPISTPQFPCMIDNLQAWIDVGYSQGQVVTGWRQMLTATRRAFPDKFFNLALITEDGFPAFLPDGAPVYQPPATVQRYSNVMVTKLVEIAAESLPAQLVVQSNGLVNAQQLDTITIHLSQSNGALLAWQTNEWELQDGGAACGGTRQSPVKCQTSADFLAMLMTGVNPPNSTGTTPAKASYLELFAPNIIAFPDAVLQAHNALLSPSPSPTPGAKTGVSATSAPALTAAPTLNLTPEAATATVSIPSPMPAAMPTAKPMPEPLSPSTPVPSPMPGPMPTAKPTFEPLLRP